MSDSDTRTTGNFKPFATYNNDQVLVFVTDTRIIEDIRPQDSSKEDLNSATVHACFFHNVLM